MTAFLAADAPGPPSDHRVHDSGGCGAGEGSLITPTWVPRLLHHR